MDKRIQAAQKMYDWTADTAKRRPISGYLKVEN
jgi:hypothetical protein